MGENCVNNTLLFLQQCTTEHVSFPCEHLFPMAAAVCPVRFSVASRAVGVPLSVLRKYTTALKLIFRHALQVDAAVAAIGTAHSLPQLMPGVGILCTCETERGPCTNEHLGSRYAPFLLQNREECGDCTCEEPPPPYVEYSGDVCSRCVHHEVLAIGPAHGEQEFSGVCEHAICLDGCEPPALPLSCLRVPGAALRLSEGRGVLLRLCLREWHLPS